ncbi:hypothetical protein GF376_03940 [Candidatus Peregrinibacteria bacterium]|nr:hypothetical protein [Candidatus Peregrinibacteria bacterium]
MQNFNLTPSNLDSIKPILERLEYNLHTLPNFINTLKEMEHHQHNLSHIHGFKKPIKAERALEDFCRELKEKNQQNFEDDFEHMAFKNNCELLLEIAASIFDSVGMSDSFEDAKEAFFGNHQKIEDLKDDVQKAYHPPTILPKRTFDNDRSPEQALPKIMVDTSSNIKAISKLGSGVRRTKKRDRHQHDLQNTG